MKKTILMLMLLFAAFVTRAQDGREYLRQIEGSYVEMFTSQGILSPRYDSLWLAECAKYVEPAHVVAAAQVMRGFCNGTLRGAEAESRYRVHPEETAYSCGFTGNLYRLRFEGDRISGTDRTGRVLFSHAYALERVEEGEEGKTYLYKSKDADSGEYTYFYMLGDTPAKTYHLEFRYGDRPEHFTEMSAGPYAYWMAAAISEGKPAEHEACIRLFCEEKIGYLCPQYLKK